VRPGQARLEIRVFLDGNNNGVPDQAVVVELRREFDGQLRLNLVKGHLSRRVERKESLDVA
jgi:hypothetical protein